MIFIVAVIVLEYFPLNIPSDKETYITNKDIVLKRLCTEEPLTVLEIPVTHFDARGGIAAGLSYITKTQLASTFHGCNLVNGYSGFDLNSIQQIKDSIYILSSDSKIENLHQLLIDTGANIVVVNEEYLLEEEVESISRSIDSLKKESKIKQVQNNIFYIK